MKFNPLTIAKTFLALSFQLILASFLHDFCIISALFWNDFGIILGQKYDFRIILDRQI